MFVEQFPQRIRDGKADMMKGSIRESIFNLSYPFISEDFPAGSTETTFTGMRNNGILIGMIQASIFMVTKLLRVSTGKHFFYNRRDIIRDRVFILSKVIWPVTAKDFFYGVSF